VGAGGSYTTETTYKYVGAGAGEFEFQAVPTKSRMPIIIGVVVVLLVVVLLVVLMAPTPSSTMKSSISVGSPKDCLLWGDPHVETFDGSFPNFYGEGEFWVVRTDKVQIQGRYLATPFTNGLAATHQIIIGCAFMGGSRFSVGPLENGQITCDDQPTLSGFPSTGLCGGKQMSYDALGTVVDSAQADLEKHIVHFRDTTLGLEVEIFRWANHLNVRVRMTPRVGVLVDGSCGNMNGNAADDTTEAIMGRLGGRIAATELLFRHPAQVSGHLVQKTIADCEITRRERALQLCAASTPGSAGVLLDACIFDVCFGGDQYAAEDATTESEVKKY